MFANEICMQWADVTHSCLIMCIISPVHVTFCGSWKAEFFKEILEKDFIGKKS